MRNRLTILMLGVLIGVAAVVSPMAARQATNPEQYVGADFKSIVFDGTKATAANDVPLDPSAEVVMTASFDGATANISKK